MSRTLLRLAAVVAVAVLGFAAASDRHAPDPPFFFVQLTDPQFGMFAANTGFAQETANLEFAVASVKRLRPAFVVVTGDLVNRTGDEAQTAEYLRVMRKLDPAIKAFSVPGNHDVGNEPTPGSIADYTRRIGPDHFSFRHGGFTGIVVNSCLLFAPQKAPAAAAEQDKWLSTEFASAKRDGARHIVVFQHHPLFVKDPDEPDQFENLPLERRGPLLALFREAGVRYVFAGHYHQNAVARAGNLEVVTTGPIGMPLRGARSGLLVAIVSDAGIEHRYYDLGELPNRVTATEKKGTPP
jgi:3',5'-cyclic AMP phosphodiesterase CpdA